MVLKLKMEYPFITDREIRTYLLTTILRQMTNFSKITFGHSVMFTSVRTFVTLMAPNVEEV